MSHPITSDSSLRSQQALASLGEGCVAYIRAVRSELVGFIYAQAPLLKPGHTVFVLHAADGTPISLTDSAEAAAADAATCRLNPVSLH